MKRYINCKDKYGIKTLIGLYSKDYANKTIFWNVILNTLKNYQISGQKVYLSKRASKEWYQK